MLPLALAGRYLRMDRIPLSYRPLAQMRTRTYALMYVLRPLLGHVMPGALPRTWLREKKKQT
jgi:hypothetical protein